MPSYTFLISRSFQLIWVDGCWCMLDILSPPPVSPTETMLPQFGFQIKAFACWQSSVGNCFKWKRWWSMLGWEAVWEFLGRRAEEERVCLDNEALQLIRRPAGRMGDVCVQTSASTICLIVPRQRIGNTSFCGVNHTGTEAALWLMTLYQAMQRNKLGSWEVWFLCAVVVEMESVWFKADTLIWSIFEDLPEPKPKTTAVTTTTITGLTFRAGVTSSMQHYTFLNIFSFPEKQLGKKSTDYINLPRTTRCLERKPIVRTCRCIKMYFYMATKLDVTSDRDGFEVNVTASLHNNVMISKSTKKLSLLPKNMSDMQWLDKNKRYCTIWLLN